MPSWFTSPTTKDRANCPRGKVAHRGLERAIAISQQHARTTVRTQFPFVEGTTVRHQQVEFAVLVHVRYRHGIGIDSAIHGVFFFFFFFFFERGGGGGNALYVCVRAHSHLSG